MESCRIQREIARSPEEAKQLAEIQARFQTERPSLAELLASGDVTEIVLHGEYLDSLAKTAKSKRPW